jgi:hypothetical protein
MRTEWIDGLTITHNLTPLPEQEWMWALDAKEMESSSKIGLRDVSWWMSIKDAYRLGVLVIAKLSKEGCISLAIGRRPFRSTHKHDWSRCGPPSTWKMYYFKMVLSKIQNLEHKNGTIRAQFLKKRWGTILHREKAYTTKDIGSRAWRIVKGP